MIASRILSHLFKHKSWRGYFGRRELNQPSGRKPNSSFQYLEYLQSSAGRKAISILIPGISLAASFSLALGDWFFYQSYINNFETLEDESKRKGAFKILLLNENLNYSEKMASLSYEVARDIGLGDRSAKKVKVFRSNSPYHLSLGIQKNNAITPFIGYPFFMDWNSPSEVSLEKAVIKTNWNPVSAMGFKFLNEDLSDEDKELFIYSNQARKFMLGKALLETDSDRIVSRFLIPVVGINGAHFIIRTIKNNFKTLFSSLTMRILLNTGITLFFCHIILLTFTMDSLEREYNQIKTLISLSEDYRQGGLEYYSKLKQLYSFLHKNIEYSDFYFTKEGEMTKYRYMFYDESLSSLQGRIDYCTKFTNEDQKSALATLFPF